MPLFYFMISVMKTSVILKEMHFNTGGMDYGMFFSYGN